MAEQSPQQSPKFLKPFAAVARVADGLQQMKISSPTPKSSPPAQAVDRSQIMSPFTLPSNASNIMAPVPQKTFKPIAISLARSLESSPEAVPGLPLSPRRRISILRTSSAPAEFLRRARSPFSSLDIREDRMKEDLQQHQLEFPWAQKGEIVYKPLLFLQKLGITKEFLSSEDGKEILQIAKAIGAETPETSLLEMKFFSGTCVGQAYAGLLSFMKNRQNKREILKDVSSHQILYFQTLERFRQVKKREVHTLDGNVNTVYVGFSRAEEMMYAKIQRETGLIATKKSSFDVKRKDQLNSALSEITKQEYTAIQMTLYFEDAEKNHAVIVFYGENPFFYDSQSGLFSYKNREDLAHDLSKFFSERMSEKDPLIGIYTQGFAQESKSKDDRKDHS
jgi:hypothetical protein